MTSHVSGISTSAASTETAASPDRTSVIFNLGMQAGQQLAAQRARLDAALPHVVAIAESEGLERSHAAARLAAALPAAPDTEQPAVLAFPGAKRRGHLAVVPDTFTTPQPEPERRVTPCPPGCTVDHSDPHEDGDYHYTDTVHTGPLYLYLNVDSDDSVTLDLNADQAQGNRLELDEVDELIAVLTAKRAEMAAEIARRTTLRPTGGAA